MSRRNCQSEVSTNSSQFDRSLSRKVKSVRTGTFISKGESGNLTLFLDFRNLISLNDLFTFNKLTLGVGDIKSFW